MIVGLVKEALETITTLVGELFIALVNNTAIQVKIAIEVNTVTIITAYKEIYCNKAIFDSSELQYSA